MNSFEYEAFIEDFEQVFDKLQDEAIQQDERAEEIARLKEIPAFRMLVVED